VRRLVNRLSDRLVGAALVGCCCCGHTGWIWARCGGGRRFLTVRLRAAAGAARERLSCWWAVRRDPELAQYRRGRR
jgi:hypothetical protein